MAGGDPLQVHINGILSDRYDTARKEEEGGAGGSAHTSISLYYQDFHLLVDAGTGVANSLEKA